MMFLRVRSDDDDRVCKSSIEHKMSVPQKKIKIKEQPLAQ